MRTTRARMSQAEADRLAANLAWDKATRDQPCKSCGATQGEPCFTQSGQLTPNYHVGRTSGLTPAQPTR